MSSEKVYDEIEMLNEYNSHTKFDNEDFDNKQIKEILVYIIWDLVNNEYIL